MTVFHQNLKIARSLKNLTQKQVADALGIKIKTYCPYEQGRAQPSYEKLIMLSELFDVTIDFLLTGNSITLREECSPWEQEYNRATMHTKYNVNKLLGV
jgi:transcriptional regulator with XRE-family HTH domain